MYRFALDYLKDWKHRGTRRPIVVRGARQVGKSHLVRMFAKEAFENILEINFERIPGAASLFDSKDPKTICPLLEARFNVGLLPGKTLLFLDEIQAAPEVFAALRFFREDLPDLHVVAAGSLLEFVLDDHAFSMPVGRIEYLHLGPMQFEEFLHALGRDALVSWLCSYWPGDEVPEEIHTELMRFLRSFLVIGGMPEVVRTFASENHLQECEALQEAVLSTYRDDFTKYTEKVKHRRVQKVFERIPRLVGQKFMYSHVDREERSRELAQALLLLCLARVAHKVPHTHGNGLPLGAEASDRHFKVLFLDVGLLCRSCGLHVLDMLEAVDVMPVNSGAICEQFVGQHLLYSRAFYEEPRLYCWIRPKRSSNAEVDYIVATGDRILPIEVKSGKTGTLKSLHLFLREKKKSLALRFNADMPSLLDTRTSLPSGRQTPFRLLSLPLYMVGQWRRLIHSVQLGNASQ